jgi:hypothetical protein
LFSCNDEGRWKKKIEEGKCKKNAEEHYTIAAPGFKLQASGFRLQGSA